MSVVAKLTRHTVSSDAVEIDGDTACSEADCDAQILEDTPDGLGVQLLRRAFCFVGQFERRDGWRSTFRKTALDWKLFESPRKALDD
jgi:hypothetical protein